MDVKVEFCQLGGLPVLIIDHPESDQIDAELMGLINKIPEEQWGWALTDFTHKVSDNTFDSNAVDKDSAPLFMDHLTKSLNVYWDVIQYQGLPTYEMKASWFTRTGEKQRAAMHHHGDCHLSGVYYLPGCEDKGGIIMQNPNYLIMNNPLVMLSKVGESGGFNPKKGRLILFLAQTLHSTMPNTSSDPRYSLSFNLFMGNA